MNAQVFFTPQFDYQAIHCIFEKALAELPVGIKTHERVAIKVHFGEQGNTGFVSPEHIQPIIERLKTINQNYFLTDANTLYRGMRYNATDHRRIALEHGFGILDTPIVIADGDFGEDEQLVEINKDIFQKVKIAPAIAAADVILAVSHFKGHIMFGFGGAIKNIGMGSGSRAGKLEMHSKIRPWVGSGCTGCGTCVENCATTAITLVNDLAVIKPALCTGCAKCIAICEFGAIDVPWSGATSRDVMARTAEYACGAIKGKKCLCITFINKITKDCDCLPDTRLIGNDVGIVASIDPVACDRAAYDLVLKNHNHTDIFRKVTGIDGTFLLDYAALTGLGFQEYSLEIC